MAEYLTYPFKIMRITQNYFGITSHKPHTTGNIKDFPIDEAGKDAGRDAVYARCKMKIVRIYTKGTNTIWLESTEKVKLANGKTDYVSWMLIHLNDSDIKRLKVGQTFKKGDIICYEGMDGATGNHIHIAVGMGKITGNGWAQNSNGKWVLTTTKGTIKPEDAFYIDKSFTTIKEAKGLKFKELPKNTTTKKTSSKPKYTVGNYKVTKADLLNVRKGAGTKYKALTFSQLSKSAQSKILALTKNIKRNGYVRNLTFTVTKVKDNWGKTPSGWVCLDYCTRI